MKDKEAVDYFRETLMERVYFTNVELWNAILEGKAKSNQEIDLRERLSKLSSEQMSVIKDIIPKITQTAIHYFLWTIDDGHLDLVFSKDSAKPVSLKENSDGLAGDFWELIDDLNENSK
jgi:hypothetical protein